MSWIEKIKLPLNITCGDGRSFTVLWRNASRSREYNIAEFEFPELEGTLVKRGTPKGFRYNIEFYIQGENHLDDSATFERSARDKRPWVISHPLYGNIIVQPISLTFDNSQMNVTTITGQVVETIQDDAPKISIPPADYIKLQEESIQDTFTNSYDVIPDGSDINVMTQNNDRLYKRSINLIPVTVDVESYFNLFNKSNSLILDATTEPLLAIRGIQNFIRQPAFFALSVSQRLKIFQAQYDVLRATYIGTSLRTRKKNYENNTGVLIAAAATSTATPQEGDYGNANDVLNSIDPVLAMYNQYIEDLDDMQTDNGGGPDSFIPDANSLISLNNIVNYTVSNLINIALNSKQERKYLCEDDTNLIELTHRFYGLDEGDENLDSMIRNNNIGLSEMLQIKKGREIIYYV